MRVEPGGEGRVADGIVTDRRVIELKGDIEGINTENINTEGVDKDGRVTEGIDTKERILRESRETRLIVTD